jgi:hypothetical protein
MRCPKDRNLQRTRLWYGIRNGSNVVLTALHVRENGVTFSPPQIVLVSKSSRRRGRPSFSSFSVDTSTALGRFLRSRLFSPRKRLCQHCSATEDDDEDEDEHDQQTRNSRRSKLKYPPADTFLLYAGSSPKYASITFGSRRISSGAPSAIFTP